MQTTALPVSRRDAQSGDGVGQAASGGDHAHADFAGGARVGVGGIGGRLLVAHVDQLDVVVAQLAEDREQMPAVDRETILDRFSRITRAINSPPSAFAIARSSLRKFSARLESLHICAAPPKGRRRSERTLGPMSESVDIP